MGRETNAVKHGMYKHPLYKTWKRIKNRCYNKNSKDYKDYGERGIEMCELWKDDFVEFMYWSLKNGWAVGLTIERVDYNKGYSPENCKWIPMSEQSKNRRTVNLIEYKGESHTISEWAKITGISRRTLNARINSKSFTVEEAFETPVNKKLSRRRTVQGRK